MDDCLKSIESCVDLNDFLGKLETLSGYIESDKVEVDKAVAKSVLSSFMTYWKFASKEKDELLELYFSLLSSVQFFSPIAKPFLKLAVTHTGKRSAKWTYTLLRMCCIMFCVDIPELASDILETKIKLVQEIAENSSRLGELSVGYMIRMQNCPSDEEKEAFIDSAISICVSRRDTLLLAGCHFCKAKAASKRDETLASLVKAFLAILSAARATPAPQVLEAEGQLVAMASHEVLSKDLIPAISRAVKRNNQVAVPCMIKAIQSLRVDSSRYLSFLLDTLMFYLKQETAEAMMAVSKVIQQAISRASDVEMIAGLIESIVKELDSIRPTPAIKKQVYSGIACVLENVNHKLMEKSDLTLLNEKVSMLMLGIWKKETNSTVKNSILGVFSSLVAATETVKEELLKIAEDGLKVATSFSQALFLVYHLVTIRASVNVQTVLPILEETVKKAIAKPFAAGRDGLVALPTLISMSIQAGKDMSALISSALAEGSFVYQLSLLSSSNKEDEVIISNCHECVSSLLRILLTSHTASAEEEMRFAHYYFSVIDHASAQIKQHYYIILRKLVQTRGSCSTLLNAFYTWLQVSSSIPFYNDEYPLTKDTLLTILHILQHGVIVEEDLCMFAWCASHPFLVNEHHPAATWKMIVGSMKPIETPELFVNAFLAIVHDEAMGVTSTNAVLAVTTQRMIRNLCSIPACCELVYSNLIDELTEFTQSAGVNGITSKDLSIWQTPDNVEWKPRQEDAGYIPEISVGKQKQRAKKGSNPFGKNDDAWIEEYKAEANKEQIAKEAAEKAIAARTKILAEQSAVREAVDAIAKPYRTALITLQCIMEGGKYHILPYLTSCMHLISSMLTNPLVCDLARSVFIRGTCCIPHPTLASLLSNTLFHVFYMNFYERSLMDITSESLEAIRTILEVDVIPSCCLPFFLPIMKAVAFSSECASTYAPVSSILELFSMSEDDFHEDMVRYFRYEACEILLELLRVAPRVDPSPESVLMNFCDAAPALQQREVFLLLGDHGLLNDSEDVRMNSLLNLDGIENASTNLLYIIRLFMTQFDVDEEIAGEAQQQWEEKGLSINPTFYLPLFQLLGHSVRKIRLSAARAVAKGLLEHPKAVKSVLDKIESKCEEIEAIEDRKEREEQTMVVLSLFNTLKECATEHVFDQTGLMEMLNILLNHGFATEEDSIRSEALQAGEALMGAYGAESTQVLLQFLNTTLTALEKDAVTDEEAIIQDHQREGCIVLLGKVSCFLDDGDRRIFSTVDILIKSLSIPSASVQEAVARCLTPLFKNECLRTNAKTYVDGLLKQLTEGATYADRRGAAVGLAGTMKGLSSKAFKEFNINSFIETAAQSDSMMAREGSMLVLEALFDSLTFMFEPYVVKFLPLLLENLACKDQDVREAAQGASRSVMRNLSPHGVKLVMPKVLEGLNDHRWRTKVVAIQMLGSMAYCSPQSLSACLPRIVPLLTEACNDTHSQIQEAAKVALIDIGNVIRTPEIADLQQTLLKALTEPHIFTGQALNTLTKTIFQHTMDAPSLSLIIPILMRGLNERVTDTKKKAALIVGNICSLANRDDVLPYLPKLLPPLKKCLMDPLPDVRAVAAHSIGMLGREVGEEEMKEVLEWLIEKVYEDSTVAERSGAAQGLADLLSSSSKKTFDSILGELLQNSTHPRPYVREGVMWTISFLPSTLGEDFIKLVAIILPSIVSGLADESEMVAEVALRAGQVLVKTYAKSQLAIILPPIKEAMMDDDWRIRQSSIMLMGELLYTLGKTKAVGISESENDTGLSSDSVEMLLQQELGMDTWIEVMASLFYLTTDVTATVRQSAFQVWKSVVNNTPRTLKKLLGCLTQLCFKMFTSDSENKRTLAARCLGEIVQKLGEFVIPHVLEVLNNGLSNTDPVIRQVVCIGFVQVLQNCSSSVLKTWGDQFLESLKTSICDDHESVREAAAEALTLLQRKGTGDVFDRILPILLADLEDDKSERQHRALNGLKQIIVLQGKQIIQTLFYKLTVHPLTVAHLHVLNCIIPSTVKFLHYFINDMMADFFQVLYGKNDEAETPLQDEELASAIHETLRCMVVNIQTFGAQWTISCLDKLSNYLNNGYRREACKLVGDFCVESSADYEEQMQMILRLLIRRAADADTTVILSAWSALTQLLQKHKVEEMLQYVAYMGNMIATVISSERYKPGVNFATYMLPAFMLKEGLKPLFQFLQKGIMVASTERKADCASLICDLVQYAPAENVRLYALQVTGPLIRIVGDKYNSEVRATIFRALNLLLGKSGDALRPFLPQLQTTFIRALKDSSKDVREQGSQALVHIIKLSNRIDNVINDLSSDIVNNDVEIRESIMISLQNIMSAVGAKVQPQTRSNVETRMVDLLFNEAADIRTLAAGVLGVCLSFSDDATFASIVESTILAPAAKVFSSDERHGRCIALGQLLKYNNERATVYHDHIIEDVTQYLQDDVILIRKSGISVCKYVLNIYNTMSSANKQKVIKELIKELTACVTDSNSSVRYETVISISLFGKVCTDTELDLLACLVPSLLKTVQDSYIPVKIASERALVHLLRIHEDPAVLENYLQSISVQDARYLKTYVQRVLVKLPKSTDDDLGDF